MLGLVDGAHSAVPEKAAEHVAVGDRLSDERLANRPCALRTFVELVEVTHRSHRTPRAARYEGGAFTSRLRACGSELTDARSSARRPSGGEHPSWRPCRDQRSRS